MLDAFVKKPIGPVTTSSIRQVSPETRLLKPNDLGYANLFFVSKLSDEL